MRGRQPTKPDIPGYIVWDGRQLWHARYNGSCAEANRKGLRWHVVAESPQQLVDEVNRPWPSPPGEGRR